MQSTEEYSSKEKVKRDSLSEAIIGGDTRN